MSIGAVVYQNRGSFCESEFGQDQAIKLKTLLKYVIENETEWSNRSIVEINTTGNSPCLSKVEGPKPFLLNITIFSKIL